MLDGANRIPNLVARAKELEMPAMAITDHGVMFGAMPFYWECKRQGVKPIIGVEAYVAPKGIHHKKGDGEKGTYHLLLLAENLEGYRNLCKLTSIAAIHGFYSKPRVDHDLLRQYSKGIIATSSCLASEVNQELERGNYDRAQYIAGMYKEMFGPDNFLIELQDHGLATQHENNPYLIKIARELKLPLIATNDAHYLCKEDNVMHDTLLCIQTGSIQKHEDRFKFPGAGYHVRTQEEMAALFADVPEALENTFMIAERCNVDLEKQRAPMPQPEVPSGVENFDYLRQLSVAGLQDRVRNADEAMDRLNYELDVIQQTNFGDYFLLVREFAQVSRQKGIYFGVRGSAAGSLVSYCIGITDVNPVEYGLTFERFLNPERVSMPDVDMDFEDARREEIIQYVTERFGEDHVAQIITFGTLGAKAALKDCGRVKEMAPAEVDRITKLIPNTPGITLDRAFEEVTEFRELISSTEQYKELFASAKSVEGFIRNSGVHAAGVVISRDPLVDYVPLYRGTEGKPITAYEMGVLEKMGMLKMDFLGLSNLTVLARAVDLIKETTGQTVDIRNIEDGDVKTYDMLGRGETAGVFQLEGEKMTKYVKQLKPVNVRELAAMVALYRPGPMEHIPRFIDTKFGRRKAEYLHPLMEPILQETFGVIVYQDQVMELVKALAGFTLGKADILRRAMGKKDVKQMASMKVEFTEGCAARQVPSDVAEKVWELLLPFAGYAFNKAHAVCYAILAYQTAYLKANYPVEYMSALLSVYLDKEDKVTSFIEDCRRMKITVRPPSVNHSRSDFTVEKDRKGSHIRFGMLAIKGVGDAVVKGIVQARETDGPFTHLFEFAARTKEYGLNRMSLESLIRAGALDCIDPNRRKLLNHAEGALEFADSQLKQRLAGQADLFGELGDSSVDYPVLPDCEPNSRTENLSGEKETIGVYVSDHPLKGLEKYLRHYGKNLCAAVQELPAQTPVTIAGVISKVRDQSLKNGSRMRIMSVEDFSGVVNVKVFAKTMEKYGDLLKKDQLVVIKGMVTVQEFKGESSTELRLDHIEALDTNVVLPDYSEQAVVIQVSRATVSQLKSFKELVRNHPGPFEVLFEVPSNGAMRLVPLDKSVDGSAPVVDAIRGLFECKVTVLDSTAA